MIQIRKPKKRPVALAKQGVKKTKELKRAYDAGQRTFSDFDNKIYGEQEVKKTLRQAQHGKFAFCESRIDHVSYGDIEHYRPKAAVAQKEGDPLDKPGYYWLAYEWKNLFYCCELCNQRFKRNLFPLRDPTKRARSHYGNIAEEEPLLLDPGSSEPLLHVSFQGEAAIVVNNSLVGLTTIEVMGLNRIDLFEKRRDALRRLRIFAETRDTLRLLAQKQGTLPPDLQQLLLNCENEILLAQMPEAEYSSMARALFQ